MVDEKGLAMAASWVVSMDDERAASTVYELAFSLVASKDGHLELFEAGMLAWKSKESRWVVWTALEMEPKMVEEMGGDLVF